MKKEVKAVCTDCGGSGLYCGFMEAPGEAVVCVRCQGTGCYVFSYKPFEKRRRRRGIKTIRKSAGAFLATGVGGVGRTMTYSEFEKSF